MNESEIANLVQGCLSRSRSCEGVAICKPLTNLIQKKAHKFYPTSIGTTLDEALAARPKRPALKEPGYKYHQRSSGYKTLPKKSNFLVNQLQLASEVLDEETQGILVAAVLDRVEKLPALGTTPTCIVCKCIGRPISDCKHPFPTCPMLADHDQLRDRFIKLCAVINRLKS